MPDPAPDTAGVLAPPPLVFGGALAAGLVLHAIAPLPLAPPPVRALGVPLAGAGVALVLAAVRSLRAARTAVEPWKPTTSIVVAGPYGRTRNPIYLAMALAYGGVTLATNAGWAALLLPPTLLAIRRGVIDREERYLEARFGDEYRAYRARVRRWL